jgi:hypothetical protein
MRSAVVLAFVLAFASVSPAHAGARTRRPMAAVTSTTAPSTATATATWPSRTFGRTRAASIRAGGILRKTPGAVVRGVKASPSAVARGGKLAATWIEQNPKTAIGLGAGVVAMFGMVLYVAPVVQGVVAGVLTEPLGVTVAAIVGTAFGGALASGSRSLAVYGTPMALGVERFNPKQLATDVSLSTGFGFVGFAQAASLAYLTTKIGAIGAIGVGVVTFAGLIGYEMLKDFLQLQVRNRVANNPKRFRDIGGQLLVVETLSNAHRALPGLSTSFTAKVLGDLIGGVLLERVVNRVRTMMGGEDDAGAATTASDAHLRPAALATES